MMLRLLFAAASVALLASPMAVGLSTNTAALRCQITTLDPVIDVAVASADYELRTVGVGKENSVQIAYRCIPVDPPLPLDGCTGTWAGATAREGLTLYADQTADSAPAGNTARARGAAQGQANEALLQEAKYDLPAAAGSWQRATVTNAEGAAGDLGAWAPGYAASRPADGSAHVGAQWGHALTWYGCI